MTVLADYVEIARLELAEGDENQSLEFKLSEGQGYLILTLRFADGGCEIVTLDALEQARDRGCRRIWLVTTNEDSGAQAFYGACGWEQVATHRGAVTLARRLTAASTHVGEKPSARRPFSMR